MEIEEEKCEIENTIEFLSRKHMLRVLQMLFTHQKPLRFSDFSESLRINSKTLSDRLKELTSAGIITRYSYDEIPPRVEYQLTSVGLELINFFSVLDKFSLKYIES